MKKFEFRAGKSFLLRLDYGRELIKQLEEFLVEEKVKVAYINAIGAVRNASIGYYDQEKKEYVKKVLDEPLEILSLTGNVSLKNGKPFCHLHVILGKDGEIYGGHLFEAEVFACEVFVLVLEGDADIPIRKHDNQTGLQLWD